MEPRIYLGASSRHVHCERYDFKAGEIANLFGSEKPDERFTWLDIRNCTGTLDSKSLSLLPNLNYLNIDGSTLEILPKAFECLPKLGALDFRKSAVNLCKEQFENCPAKHLHIEELSIPDTDCLFHLKDLDKLTFENCKFDNFSGNIVHNLSSLEYLFINRCQMESLGDLHKDVPQLQHLFITTNKIGQIDCEAIMKLENLEQLSLIGNETDTQIKYKDFKKLTKLETILFDISVYDNIDFSSFPNLKKVQIGTYGGEGTEEEQQLVNKLESLNLEFEYQFCGTIEVDMTRVQICA